jgi:hypothetical protein
MSGSLFDTVLGRVGSGLALVTTPGWRGSYAECQSARSGVILYRRLV